MFMFNIYFLYTKDKVDDNFNIKIFTVTIKSPFENFERVFQIP